MSRKNFDTDMGLEIKCTDEIKQILGMAFFGKEVVADLNEGIDFAIFRSDPVSIAVRLRRYKYYKWVSYRNQFTIRWRRSSGVETEIDKIKAGLVDYFMYGFVDATESQIVQYFIGDLRVFNQLSLSPVAIKRNRDGSSSFGVYSLEQFPVDFVVNSNRCCG